MNNMETFLLYHANYEALTLKDLIRYTPNDEHEIYYHLGRMQTYQEAYKELCSEEVTELTLRNIASAEVAIYNWERGGSK